MENNAKKNQPAITQVYDNVGPEQGPVEQGGHTDDRRPVVSGTALRSALVRILTYVPGATPPLIWVGIGSANFDGDWEIPLGRDLPLGPQWLIPETDVGNGVPFALTVVSPVPAAMAAARAPGRAPGQALAITDVTTASGESLPPGGTTSERQLMLSGTGTPNTVLSLLNHGVPHGTYIMVLGDGHWSVEVELPPGAHSLTVQRVGMGGETSAPFDLTIEGEWSAVPQITRVIDDIGAETGELSSGAVTDDAWPQVSGTGEIDRRVGLYSGDREVTSTRVGGSGEWSIEVRLVSGHHRLTARNEAGQASEPFELTVHSATLVEVSADGQVLEPGAVIEGSDLSLRGTAMPGTRVIIQDNGQPVLAPEAGVGGHWSASVTLPPGPHSLTVKALWDNFDTEPFEVTTGAMATRA